MCVCLSYEWTIRGSIREILQRNTVGTSDDIADQLIHVMSAGRNVEQQIPLQQRPPSLAMPSMAQRPRPEPGFSPLHGGFRDHFVTTPEPKYCCETCRLVLCNPRQTECGHRFCESCINELLSKPNPVCPADLLPLFEDKIFRDVCCNREIMALKVYCRSEKNGCKEQMCLQQVMEHLVICPYFEVPCPLGKCKEKMMRKDMPEHLSRKCKHREVTCEFCSLKMALTELQKHKETVCPAFPVACPNHCSFSSILRSEVGLDCIY